MLLALRDFELYGIKVKSGDVVPPLTFEADQVVALVASEYLKSVDEPKAPKTRPEEPKESMVKPVGKGEIK